MLSSAHGLLIQSDIDLPDLEASLPLHETSHWPRIDIRAGGDAAQAADSQAFTLQIESQLRFHITPETIVYQRLGDVDDSVLRLLLTGTCLGALLMLRRTPGLHAAAVRLGNGCVAICGEQGAGKSTLSAALGRAGHPKLADDLAAVEFTAQAVPMVLPGVPQSKLRVDALERMGVASAGLRPVATRSDKFHLPETPWRTPEPLCCIVELVRDAAAARITLEPVSGLDAVSLLTRHVHGRRLIVPMGLGEMFLDWTRRLTGRVPIYRLRRPEDRDTVDELSHELRQLWLRLGHELATV